MGFRGSPSILALATTLTISAARAFDDSRYPSFSGVWRKPVGIGNQWDQTKPSGSPRTRRCARRSRAAIGSVRTEAASLSFLRAGRLASPVV
jgi:hypothetical protein